MLLGRQATMEWEAQDEGFLAKILVAEGTKDIAVGTPVAVVVEDANDVRPAQPAACCASLTFYRS